MERAEITAVARGAKRTENTRCEINIHQKRKVWEIMRERKVPVQSLIDHIKTAVDVDPWAKEMAEELLKKQEPKLVLNIGEQISCKSGSCPNCGKMLNSTCNKKFCGDCGQEVKWE